jgi:hypothetical protein
MGPEQFTLAMKALDETPDGFRQRMGLRQPIRRGRALTLPFWGEGWGLYDLEADTPDATTALAFIAGPDGLVVVDGTSPPIHQLNHDLAMAPFADPETALAYLRVFCGVVWGDAGPFAIVDTDEEASRWLKEPLEGGDPEIPAFLRTPLVKPAEFVGRQGEDWRFSANVVHQGSLFASVFVVSSDGRVEMVEDDVVFQGSSALTFLPPIRLTFEARP